MTTVHRLTTIHLLLTPGRLKSAACDATQGLFTAARERVTCEACMRVAEDEITQRINKAVRT